VRLFDSWGMMDTGFGVPDSKLAGVRHVRALGPQWRELLGRPAARGYEIDEGKTRREAGRADKPSLAKRVIRRMWNLIEPRSRSASAASTAAGVLRIGESFGISFSVLDEVNITYCGSPLHA
jgi:hypothetical protein